MVSGSAGNYYGCMDSITACYVYFLTGLICVLVFMGYSCFEINY